jgi:transglutaminase-like putative cysteine protease
LSEQADVYASHLGSVGRADYYQTGGQIEQHIALIRSAKQESVLDPETRSLAVALVSRSFDEATDPRSRHSVPAVPYHGRFYRGASSWAEARALCRPRDARCEITAIWNFVVLNLFYTGDVKGKDTYQTLQASLEAGGGDCDDLAVALIALLEGVGYTCRARVISLSGKTWDHIYPLVYLPRLRQWMALDATEAGQPMGWEFPDAAAKKDFAL